MQCFLPGGEDTFFLHPFGVGYTAVYGANRSTLGLLVKANALCTLIGDDVVKLVTHGFLVGIRCDGVPRFNGVGGVDGRSFGHGPFYPAFVDSGIWAFGFAGAAVDAIVGDHDGHGGGVLVYLQLGMQVRNNINR